MSKTIKIPECSNPFIVIINGQRYEYEPGKTVEVPDEVAEAIAHHEAGHVEIPLPQEEAGGGGGGYKLYKHRVTAYASEDGFGEGQFRIYGTILKSSDKSMVGQYLEYDTIYKAEYKVAGIMPDGEEDISILHNGLVYHDDGAEGTHMGRWVYIRGMDNGDDDLAQVELFGDSVGMIKIANDFVTEV